MIAPPMMMKKTKNKKMKKRYDTKLTQYSFVHLPKPFPSQTLISPKKMEKKVVDTMSVK